MHTLRIIFGVLTCFIFSSRAEEALWKAELVHYDFAKPYDAWVISQTVEGGPKPQRITDLFITIFSKDSQTSSIKHIALGDLFKREDLQTDVISYLEKQETFQKSPPPFGLGRWHFKNSGEMRKLVEEALLQSKFVNSLNGTLATHKKRIGSVSMEKLYFTKEGGKVVWHAIVWLNIT